MVSDLQCKTTLGGKNRASELDGFLNWSLTLKTKANKLSWECHTQRYKLSWIYISTEAKYQCGLAKAQNYIGVGTPHMKMCSDVPT